MKYHRDFREIYINKNDDEFLCRAIRPSDKEGLTAALKDLSIESRKKRFLTLKKGFTEKELKIFTEVDFINHVALALLKVNGDLFEPVGTVRFFIDQDNPNRAEFAITILDKFQSQGVGTYLFEHLCLAARERDVKELYGTASSENTKILKLMKRAGEVKTKVVTHGVLELSLKID